MWIRVESIDVRVEALDGNLPHAEENGIGMIIDNLDGYRIKRS